MEVLKNLRPGQGPVDLPGGERALELSARNVPGVQVMLPMGLNVYDILKYDHLVLFSPALAAIEARLAK